MDKGLIHRGFVEYTVDCGNPKCRTNTFVDYLSTEKQFVASLRSSGWKIRKGLWMCPDCQHLVSIERGERNGEAV